MKRFFWKGYTMLYRQLGQVLVVLLAAPLFALGECVDVNGGGQMTAVYFSNGIRSDGDYARLQATNLEGAYRQHLSRRYAGDYRFGVAVNPTGGIVADVSEVLSQKVQELGWRFDPFNFGKLASIAEGWVTAVMASPEGLLRLLQLEFSWLVITLEDADQIISAVFGTPVSFDSSQQQVLSNHVDCYRENLRGGARVVVVAHSQGNLFTNKAIEQVATAQPEHAGSIAAIGVATPAGRKANNRSFYVTAKDDVVINGMRGVMNILRANVNNATGSSVRDRWNHFFQSSYFHSDLRSRELIDDYMDGLARRLPYPN